MTDSGRFAVICARPRAICGQLESRPYSFWPLCPHRRLNLVTTGRDSASDSSCGSRQALIGEAESEVRRLPLPIPQICLNRVNRMRAMCFVAPGQPLKLTDLPVPEPGPEQLLIRVTACGVCRTDLHVVDGELPNPKPAVVPGHEVVGVAECVGDRAGRFTVGQRVGACPGSAGPAVSVGTAVPGVKTCATGRGSPATRSTADTPSTSPRITATAFRSRTAIRTRRPLRSCEPASSGTGP